MAKPTPFGELAIQKGILTEEQLEEALQVQRQEVAGGLPYRSIGVILTDLGFLEEAQILEVLSSQSVRVPARSASRSAQKPGDKPRNPA